MPHLESAAVEGAKTLESYVYPAQLASASKIDLSAVLKQLEQLNGDTTYEELECVGLDNNTDQLVGTFRVKRPNGFSGGPCTAGSTEYVAYWADFGDDCTYTYLGTAKVTTHDYAKLPAGGLCYAAPLSVDLGAFRKPCGTPVIGRVRAVLSWGTPPSTTDPHKVPTGATSWTHASSCGPVARTTGMHASRSSAEWRQPVGFGQGLTLPGATIVENGYLPIDAPSRAGQLARSARPGARRLVLPDPGPQRHERDRHRSATMSSRFVVNWGSGSGQRRRPGPAGGRLAELGEEHHRQAWLLHAGR